MSQKTEKQNRAWLKLKLQNYLWKISVPNAYGSLKKQETIVRDLEAIISEYKKNICLKK